MPSRAWIGFPTSSSSRSTRPRRSVNSAFHNFLSGSGQPVHSVPFLAGPEDAIGTSDAHDGSLEVDLPKTWTPHVPEMLPPQHSSDFMTTLPWPGRHRPLSPDLQLQLELPSPPAAAMSEGTSAELLGQAEDDGGGETVVEVWSMEGPSPGHPRGQASHHIHRSTAHHVDSDHGNAGAAHGSNAAEKIHDKAMEHKPREHIELVLPRQSDSLQANVVCGGVLAIATQMYLWGTVFVTFFKPQRQSVETGTEVQSSRAEANVHVSATAGSGASEPIHTGIEPATPLPQQEGTAAGVSGGERGVAGVGIRPATSQPSPEPLWAGSGTSEPVQAEEAQAPVARQYGAGVASSRLGTGDAGAASLSAPLQGGQEPACIMPETSPLGIDGESTASVIATASQGASGVDQVGDAHSPVAPQREAVAATSSEGCAAGATAANIQSSSEPVQPLIVIEGGARVHGTAGHTASWPAQAGEAQPLVAPQHEAVASCSTCNEGVRAVAPEAPPLGIETEGYTLGHVPGGNDAAGPVQAGEAQAFAASQREVAAASSSGGAGAAAVSTPPAQPRSSLVACESATVAKRGENSAS